MYYKCHKVNFKRVGSYISYMDYPDWIKNKKTIINPKHEDSKYFQYASTVALNYEEIKCNPERVSNIKPFIKKYNWEGINYPSKIDDWKKFEKNIPTIALKILYIKEKEILLAYISKHNSTCENISLNDSKWRKKRHYLAVKKLSALLHKKLQNIRVIFIAWILLILLELKSHESLSLTKKYVRINVSVEL